MNERKYRGDVSPILGGVKDKGESGRVLEEVSGMGPIRHEGRVVEGYAGMRVEEEGASIG